MLRPRLRALTRILLCAALPLLVVGAAYGAAPLRRCSYRSSFLPDRPGGFAFVGRPVADTVLTGAGSTSTSQSVGPGHFSSGRPRSIYGQRVAVDRLSRATRDSLGFDATEVILVPWDYGPSCDPLPWSRSALWLSPADSGLFGGALRPREQWVDGIPTLDLFIPQFDPYPQGFDRAQRGSREVRRRVEAAEMLRILDDPRVFPEAGDTVAALAAARHWLVSGGVERVFPYDALALRAFDVVRKARELSIKTSLAGLYRLQVRWTDGGPRELYLRITPTVTGSVLDVSAGQALAVDYIPQTYSYSLAAVVAPTADSVAKSCATVAHPDFVSVRVPYGVTEGRGALTAWLTAGLPEAALLPDESKAAWARYREEYERNAIAFRLRNDSLHAAGLPREAWRSLPFEFPVEFRFGRRGRVRVSGGGMTAPLGAVELRGERIDTASVRCP